MEQLLAEFCLHSWQQVNLSKAKLWVSPNTKHQTALVISHTVGMGLTSNLGIYLGVPIHHDRVQNKKFGYLVAKVRRKLSTWRAQKLSRGAKTLLIQTVTSTLPSYTMQTTLIPAGVLAALDQLNRSFLWGAVPNQRYCSPVA